MSRYKINECHSVTIVVQMGSVPRPNSGVGSRVRGQKEGRILLHMLKSAEHNPKLKVFDTDSLVIEHTQVNKAPNKQHRTFRAHRQMNTY